MKQIMSNRSSSVVQGIGSFEFTGAEPVQEQLPIPGLGPLDELKRELVRHFAGRTITFLALLSEHEHPTATEGNYKTALLQLESEGAVSVRVPGRERRKVKGAWTLPNDAVITFKK